MDTLNPPHSHHLSAAEGWVELGNLAEARGELDRIPEPWRKHPAVMSVQWSVCAGEKNWPEALSLARQLVALLPDSPFAWLHQAYSLRRVPEGGLQAAWDVLFPALKLFPKVAIIPYNLACYACQLGQMDKARGLLTTAMSLGKDEHIKDIALQDTDLEPLWPEIREQ
jgi:tetratricopeptide (TPR) repeat protein